MTSPPEERLAAVLGSYPDSSAGSAALASIREAGFRRSGLVRRDAGGSVIVENARVSPRQGAVGGALIALALAALAFVAIGSPPIQPIHGALLALLIGVCSAAGWDAVRRLEPGVQRSSMDTFARWVLPQETLVVVEALGDQARAVLSRLGESEGSLPSTFIVRPKRATLAEPAPVRRRERFAGERLRALAAQLAAQHAGSLAYREPIPLIARLREYERVISAINLDLTQAVQLEQSVSISAEWLLDNTYIIQRHIADVQRNLPHDIYRELPVLTVGRHKGEPRAYDLATQLVANTDDDLGESDLIAFLEAYQQTSPLDMSELWAFPQLLRLGLVESLGQLAVEISEQQHQFEWADFWSNRLLVAARRAPDYLLAILAELARRFPDPSTVFADRLISQLQGESLVLGPVLSWLELRWGRPVHEAIMQGERRHAADQVTVANGITTLRVLTSLDWRDVFERVSAVDAALREDPAGVYAKMDFGTRDLYRHAVEEMSRGARAAESEVARNAVRHAASESVSPRNHVGYFLVGPGRELLEGELRFRPPAAVRLRRLLRVRSTVSYVGTVLFLTLLGLLGVLVATAGSPSLLPGASAALVLAIFAAIPASEVAVQLANFAVSLIFEPTPLPKLSFDDGIPEDCRTLVGVPVLLTSPEGVRDELDLLEIRYLANPDPSLSFALLADLVDAPQREAPRDAAILRTVIEGVSALNARHSSKPFLVFCRARRWSETEGVWMGRERKRGKLEELNELLVGGGSSSVSEAGLPETLEPIAGDPERLRGVRFVITLDADTQLPHGAAQRLVGTLAHPLNRPVVSPDRRRVVGGFTIVQPRVSSSLPSAIRTNFSRLFADTIGVDPYTHVVFDLYQDLAEEGSYYGKGIYDVGVFHDVLGGRFPESTLLSHDLLEGAFVRVGSVSDVELFDAFPAHYLTYARRQHRWIRGDWQIANWLLPRVRDASGRWGPNSLSWLNRWKLLDNLRRSLLAPFSLGLLASSWLLLPGSVLTASLLVLATVFLTPLLHFFLWLAPQPRIALSSGLALRDQAIVLLRASISVSLLPSQAGLALDAIARALYRRLFSRRRLLEWQTFRADEGSRDAGPAVSRRMGLATVGAVALLGILAAIDSARVLAALPFLVAWMASPYVVVWLNRPRDAGGQHPLSRSDRRTLRRLARETWRYFDDFVGPATNWLPPDNYQEAYRIEIAERTSPTNVGLWLLTTLSAHDLGYLTLDQAVERAEATVETLFRLERHEGHLLNWYNTRTLEPLNPRYVSTVDSGNLIASLWTLAQGFREALEGPVLGQRVLAGLEDTLELALVHDWSPMSLPRGTNIRQVERLIRRLRTALADRPNRLADIVGRVRSVSEPARELAALLGARPQGATMARAEVSADGALRPPVARYYWFGKLDEQSAAWLGFFDRYLPWADGTASFGGQSPEESDEVKEIRRRALVETPSIESLARASRPLAVGQGSTSRPGGEVVGVGASGSGGAEALVTSRSRARDLKRRVEALIDAVESLAASMDLRFLYDARRRLFTIGYNVTDRRFDPNYYDLLASEARLASFIAAARGEVPVEHWFVLGRPFGLSDDHRVLFSWSGTMFEYLMPLLFTRAERHTLLEDACREAVALQIEYGRRQRVPWGISEAAFAAVDVNQTYQYQAFGVPGLGFKRGLGDDLVVAPYATALALLVNAEDAISNFRQLDRLGLRGAYGYCESVDFTRRRLPTGRSYVVVQAYMAHHQGMTLLSLDSCLNGGSLSRRFRADHRVRAAQALLFEKVPTNPVLVEAVEGGEAPSRLPRALPAEPVIPIDAPAPSVQILGNGAYTVMITSTGGGFSRWRGLDVTRWQADTTLDLAGSYVYVRDLDSGEVWSTTYQPTRRPGAKYSVRFTPNRAEFARVDRGIGITETVTVPPDDDVEVRLISVVNHTGRARDLELTSYVELALAAHAADRAHPAFSKLFVETDVLPEQDALLARRKRRSESDPEVWAFHLIALPESSNGATARLAGFDTDRRRFVGRGRRMEDPAAVLEDLGRTVGAVLDASFSLRCQVTVSPGERVEIAYVTGAAESREAATALVDTYRNLHASSRAFETSSAHAQAISRQLRMSGDDLHRFRQLVSSLFYPAPQLRASESQLRRNRLGQSALWAYGISGDLPILLVTIDDRRDADVVAEALLAHSYWRLLGLRTDLVILNGEAGGSEQRLQADLRRAIQRYAPSTPVDQPGGIFLRTAEQIPDEDLTLLFAVARAALVAARGSLSQQLGLPVERPKLPPPLSALRGVPDEPSPPLPFLQLPYFNGLGGFTADGLEYAIYLGPGTRTPAPWANVLANPTFGALLTESGQGYTWNLNSQSNRLVPWNNDPVSPQPSDVVYIRDDDLGVYWTPTASPIRELDAYRARHGQGYTVYEHSSHALEQELVAFVPLDDAGGAPVRVQRLRLRNRSARRRKLSVFSYAEWVLGTDREESQQFVVTSWDPDGRVLLARNAYHPDFRSYVAFSSASPAPDSFTADRAEFLGRNGSYARPAALSRQALSGHTGAGPDPCAALQVVVEIDPGQSVEVCLVVGQAEDTAAVQHLVDRFRDPIRVEEAFQSVRQWWDRLLGTVQVETPVLSVNLLINRWLLYQTLSCRIWARSGFYQSGGAIGYRDQLQDCLALLYSRPGLARAQILAAAGRQFVEGDVQHWWHPRSGLGVRTRISDDLLWLPYAVTRYVQVTGDRSLLDEAVPFLDGRSLTKDETESLFVPNTSLETGSVLEHCRRAIARGSTSGPHGLPLIGSGDWNDGLNLVGVEGRGESVWLAWFLIDVLVGFAEIVVASGLEDEAAVYSDRARGIREAVEAEAWDGEWYRRAYYDDGGPLGSRESDEAKIDSIAQSWAVISGAGDPERAASALRSAEAHLVREADRLVLLFAPPFDRTSRNPGYIKGYPPGVRENGGQYTHGALWLAEAFARVGDGDRAGKLLDLLNPIERARTLDEAERYRLEPYVAAADVYSLEGHVGMGGWSWYTGSAGWMYRIWVEDVLGLKLRGGRLVVDPVIPSSWPDYTIHYRHGDTPYHIRVENPDRVSRGVVRVELDGEPLPDGNIDLLDDRREHWVTVWLGRK